MYKYVLCVTELRTTGPEVWQMSATKRNTFLFRMILLALKTDPQGLVAQWIRICLPVQGTQVQSLVWEDSTCHRATKPKSYNYRSPCTCSPRATTGKTTAMRRPCTATKSSPCSLQLEKAHTQQ